MSNRLPAELNKSSTCVGCSLCFLILVAVREDNMSFRLPKLGGAEAQDVSPRLSFSSALKLCIQNSLEHCLLEKIFCAEGPPLSSHLCMFQFYIRLLRWQTLYKLMWKKYFIHTITAEDLPVIRCHCSSSISTVLSHLKVILKLIQRSKYFYKSEILIFATSLSYILNYIVICNYFS